ncbi:Crp/Fnr family transcriptional regulator [Dehalobacter sp. MCB1]|uniref:Crp/Fnr family transcriptional regulator n=1 Tax=unclassified Dehalobacter TaxID=2635733 RepID=UPI000E6CA068|nr:MULTISPECIES: Crp/Fnr family transcriptional regulator [unclassified Dehalobacter]RJE48512.1 Crp/Fnr family transcriptional regulator [Dehalobacter sp. MCB1]TCX54825.1 Crp/Fnr family transcriptional regulator [Dehalobacter sp. 12DCB1]
MEKITNNYYILPNNFYPMKKLQNYGHLGTIRNYGKGESIVLPGELIHKIIYVISGRLSINFLNEDGRHKVMFYADPLTFADRLFPFDDCFVHVVAEESSTVWFFTQEQLFEIFQQDKEVLFDFISCYSSKCGYFMREAKEMILYNPSVRVLRLLYDLCLTQGKLVNNVYQIDIKLSQKAISEIIGVHFVTISRIFGFLKKENILYKTTNKIVVIDLERLKDLINEWMKK